MIFKNTILVFFLSISSILCSQEFGGANDPNAFKGISLQNPYGVEFPSNIKISYKDNKDVAFGDIFNKNGLPKLFILGYYECEAMCDAIREILFSDLKENKDIKLGKDYEIVMLSIDHEESLGLAKQQEEIYFNRYFSNLDKSLKKHITFAVSTKKEIEILTQKIGFEYRYNDDYLDKKDKGRQKYDHPSFVYVVSDQGVITSGTTSGRFQDDIKKKLLNAKNNYPSMDFDQLYSMTCLKGNIENENPQRAFDLVRLAGTWFVLNLGFVFGYSYLSKRGKA